MRKVAATVRLQCAFEGGRHRRAVQSLRMLSAVGFTPTPAQQLREGTVLPRQYPPAPADAGQSYPAGQVQPSTGMPSYQMPSQTPFLGLCDTLSEELSVVRMVVAAWGLGLLAARCDIQIGDIKILK